MTLPAEVLICIKSRKVKCTQLKQAMRDRIIKQFCIPESVVNSTHCEILCLEIRKMTRSSPLYKLLKEELTALGHWKNKPRGNPKAGYLKSLINFNQVKLVSKRICNSDARELVSLHPMRKPPY